MLPGHSECCLRPILQWLAEQMPEARLSLKGDYVPPAVAASAPAEYLNKDDLDSAMDLAVKIGLNLVQ